MSGLCERCMFNGDIEKCATAVCGQHESWYGVTQRATINAQAAEIAELKDEVDNLTDELMFRPKYGTLTERIAELEAKLAAVSLKAGNASLKIVELEAEVGRKDKVIKLTKTFTGSCVGILDAFKWAEEKAEEVSG